MLTFDEAKMIALNEIGPDCALYDDDILEKPYGWYFLFQSKQYMVTGNFDDQLVGSGGFIVEKEGGHVVHFGSSRPCEDWFTLYEAGLLFNWYDLTILQIHDLHKAVELLASLRLMYVIPEEENGVIWKIPQCYTAKQIKGKLSTLPCCFSGIWFRDGMAALQIFQAIETSNCCLYERTGHFGKHPAFV